MVKHYKSVDADFSTNVAVDGHRTRVRFEPCPEGGLLITAHEALQRAIEADADFGLKFSLVKSIDETTAGQPAAAGEGAPAPVDDVSNISEARNWLMRSGIPHQALRSPEQILKKATESGVWFPNLNMSE